jgi:DNA-3-methyladenine glycosylase
MHETFAHWYVYFIYGNHHCLNITCGKGSAGAVLIREAVPAKGIALMRKRRGKGKGAAERKKLSEKDLCSGPGKLCQAFAIDKSFNGLALGKKLWLEEGGAEDFKVAKLPRVGITKAKNLKWRFRAGQ